MYNCSVTVRNTLYTSSDDAFESQSNSKNKTNLSVGRYTNKEGETWYLSVAHARFALWLVLIHKGFGGIKAIEDKFIPNSDFCIVTSGERSAMDVNDNDLSMQRLPICCIMRSGNYVVALDCGLLRFNELINQRYIDRYDETPADRLKHFYNERSGQWEDLPSKRQVFYEMLLEHRKMLITFFGHARRSVYFCLPRNTKQLKEDKDGWMTIVVTDDSNKREDKYWYSPVLKRKFRSLNEVNIFKECLANYRNNEFLAAKVFTLMLEDKRKKKAQQHATMTLAKTSKRGASSTNQTNKKQQKMKKLKRGKSFHK